MSSTTASFSFSGISKAGSPATPLMGYSSALDGVRGIAILGVLAVHTNHLFGWSVLPGGNLGVDIFFTLSGFLITRLLFEEWKRSGAISLWNFYCRRVLRLAPALLIVTALLYVFAPHVFPPLEAANTQKTVPLALTYVTDLSIGFFGNMNTGALQHTWSLGIEEHFYLIWPLAMVIALKAGLSGRKLMLALTALSLVAAFERTVLFARGATALRTYYGIDARSDALLIGCVAGIAVSLRLARTFPTLNRPLVALLLVLATTTNFSTPFMHLVGFTLVSMAAAILLVNVTCGPSSLRNALEFGPLVWIGKISYGIYLWHYPIFRAIGHLSLTWPAKLIFGTVLTFGIAGTSYYLIEKPMLRLKTRFVSQRHLREVPIVLAS